MRDFSNKVIVISGTGSGMGKEMAISLSKQGARLALNDIDATAMEATAEICKSNGVEVMTMAFDVSKMDLWQNFRQQVINAYGQVDLVINNAGVALGNYTVRELKMEDFEWLMGINFWGMVYGTKVFLEDLISRPESAVVNFSSVFGLGGVSRNSAYCASKFGIRGFTEAMRMEAMAHYPHVCVQSVHPGGIQTNISRKAKWNPEYTEAERKEQVAEFETNFITTAKEAAAVVINGIQKKQVKILIGKDARQFDRLIRIFSSSYTQKIINRLVKEGKEV